jgi:hypothetical protein
MREASPLIVTGASRPGAQRVNVFGASPPVPGRPNPEPDPPELPDEPESPAAREERKPGRD